MSGLWRRIFEYMRKKSLRTGYTCDACGKELFDYPIHRLCAACEGKLRVPKLRCPLCGRETVSDGLCLTCKELPPQFFKGVTAFSYCGECGMLVNRLKNGYQRLAAYFGEKMGEVFLAEVSLEEPPLLVAVPMTKEKGLERGYNQAERLAESVFDYWTARGISADCNFKLLEKGRETKPQKRRTKRERVENVRGAFAVYDRAACKGRTIVLVDDILTTGATGSECARRLLSAGAKRVYFLTAAAVPELK